MTEFVLAAVLPFFTLVILMACTSYCSETSHSCVTGPCMNGICMDAINSSYSCYCTDGFTGYQCQTNWDECWSNPCLNEATCVDGIASFNCACAPGYTGPLCGAEINECISDPCQNNATCDDLLGGYYCDCLPGYTGVNCQIDLSVCNTSVPTTNEPMCLNGGLCVDGPALSYSCLCETGWTGTRCEEDVNECGARPCANGATCYNSPGSYACACLPEFTGVHCEHRVQYCEATYCLNGGVCIDESGNNTCYCVPDYHGDQCQDKYDECQLFAPRCMNGGTCIDGVDSFACSCPEEFSGVLCHCSNIGKTCQELPFWYEDKPFQPIPTLPTTDIYYNNMSVVYSTSTTIVADTDEGVLESNGSFTLTNIFTTEITPESEVTTFSITENVTSTDEDIFTSTEKDIASTSLDQTVPNTDIPTELSFTSTSIPSSSVSSSMIDDTESTYPMYTITPTGTMVQDTTYPTTPLLPDSSYGTDITSIKSTSASYLTTPIITTPNYDYYSVEFTDSTKIQPTSPTFMTQTPITYTSITTDFAYSEDDKTTETPEQEFETTKTVTSFAEESISTTLESDKDFITDEVTDSDVEQTTVSDGDFLSSLKTTSTTSSYDDESTLAVEETTFEEGEIATTSQSPTKEIDSSVLIAGNQVNVSIIDSTTTRTSQEEVTTSPAKESIFTTGVYNQTRETYTDKTTKDTLIKVSELPIVTSTAYSIEGSVATTPRTEIPIHQNASATDESIVRSSTQSSLDGKSKSTIFPVTEDFTDVTTPYSLPVVSQSSTITESKYTITDESFLTSTKIPTSYFNTTSSTSIDTFDKTTSASVYEEDKDQTDSCSDKKCFNGGICFKISGVSTCRCLFNYTGEFCEQYQYITIPHFNGASYLKLRTPLAMNYREGVQIYIGFTVSSSNGLIFYSESDKHGSFVMLLLRNSHLTFLFSCGIQMVSFLHANDFIASATTLHVSFKLWWTPYEAHLPWGDGKCSASLQVNNSAPLYSEQRSTSSSVILNSFYLGGLPSKYNTSWLVQAGYQPRLEGCVKTLEINGYELDIWRLTTEGENVQECGSTLCPVNACLNGGSCIPSPSEWKCNCRTGFEGQFCERESCLLSPCYRGICVPDSGNGSKLSAFDMFNDKNSSRHEVRRKRETNVGGNLQPTPSSDNPKEPNVYQDIPNKQNLKETYTSNRAEIDSSQYSTFSPSTNRTDKLNEEDEVPVEERRVASQNKVFQLNEIFFENPDETAAVTINSAAMKSLNENTNLSEILYDEKSSRNSNQETYVDMDFLEAHEKEKEDAKVGKKSQNVSDYDYTFSHSFQDYQEVPGYQFGPNDNLKLPNTLFGHKSLCLCPAGYHGKFCDNHDEIRTHPQNKFYDNRQLWPRYAGSNLAGYSSFTAYKIPFDTRNALYLSLHFRTWNPNQISLLMLIGGRPNTAKRDFIALSLIHGHVMLTWDVGGGPRRIIAPQPINMSRHTHSVKFGRKGKKAWLSVNTQRNVTGTAPGYLSSMDSDNIMFIGGHESWSFLHLPADLWRMSGFEGCAYDIRVSDSHYSVLSGNNTWVEPKVLHSRNVGHCVDTSCASNKCENGATCQDLGATYRCLCEVGWEGPFCEHPSHICKNSVKVCAEGSCVTNDNGESICICPLGRTGELCELDVQPSSTAKFRGRRSYLSVSPAESVRRHCQTSITFKPTKESGLLFLAVDAESNKPLLSGDEFEDENFLALILNNRSIALSYQSGFPGKCVNLESTEKVTLNEWNTVHFSRRGTEASLEFVGDVSRSENLPKINQRHKILGEINPTLEYYAGTDLYENLRLRQLKKRSSTVYLNVGNELYIGGAPDVNKIPSSIGPSYTRVPYEGCIKTVMVNGVNYNFGRKGGSDGVLRGQDVESCDEESKDCDDRICLNGGHCAANSQLSDHEQLSCICPEGFTGNLCQEHVLCSVNPCLNAGTCQAINSTNYICICSEGRNGRHCEQIDSPLTSVKLGESSYAFVSENSKAVPTDTYKDNIELSLKANSSNGLLLWRGLVGGTRRKDWLGVGVYDGAVKVVWALGAGGATILTSGGKIVSDNLWHKVSVERRGSFVRLRVDGFDFTAQSPENYSRRDGPNDVYIGSFKSVSTVFGTLGHFVRAFEGCILDLRLDGGTPLDFSRVTETRNIDICN